MLAAGIGGDTPSNGFAGLISAAYQQDGVSGNKNQLFGDNGIIEMVVEMMRLRWLREMMAVNDRTTP